MKRNYKTKYWNPNKRSYEVYETRLKQELPRLWDMGGMIELIPVVLLVVAVIIYFA